MKNEKDEKFTCHTCGMEFSSQAELEDHEKVVHMREPAHAGGRNDHSRPTE